LFFIVKSNHFFTKIPFFFFRDRGIQFGPPYQTTLSIEVVQMMEFISSFFKGEAGPIEYSLATALISVTAVAALTG
jgi:hypothetical protein